VEGAKGEEGEDEIEFVKDEEGRKGAESDEEEQREEEEAWVAAQGGGARRARMRVCVCAGSNPPAGPSHATARMATGRQSTSPGCVEGSGLRDGEGAGRSEWRHRTEVREAEAGTELSCALCCVWWWGMCVVCFVCVLCVCVLCVLGG
jgi:hypothetical protein